MEAMPIRTAARNSHARAIREKPKTFTIVCHIVTAIGDNPRSLNVCHIVTADPTP